MSYDGKALDAIGTALIERGEALENGTRLAELMAAPTGWEGEDDDRRLVPITYLDDEAGDVREVRHVEALDLRPAPKPVQLLCPMPQVRVVYPQSLQIEASYQRDLSAKSETLIRKIVNGWDWAKFKPPICAETPTGLFVIDGQHTAIAAATRGIRQIPVMVVKASDVPTRAKAFVAHNRDRLTMSALQLFHAEVAGEDEAAKKLLELAHKTGAKIPRSVPPRGHARPGTVIAARDLKRTLGVHGPLVVERVLRIAVGAQLAPMTGLAANALVRLLTTPIYRDVASLKDSALSNAIRAFPNLDERARAYGQESGQPQLQSASILIAEEARRRRAL